MEKGEEELEEEEGAPNTAADREASGKGKNSFISSTYSTNFTHEPSSSMEGRRNAGSVEENIIEDHIQMVKEYSKRRSVSLILREWWFSHTTVTHHFQGSEWPSSRRQEIGTGEDVEKMEALSTVGGHVSWRHHYEKLYGGSSKNENYYTV